MAQLYFSAQIDNDRAIYISPLADDDVDASGDLVEDASGYFLYERRRSSFDSPVTLLARLHSEDAAVEMSRLLNLS